MSKPRASRSARPTFTGVLYRFELEDSQFLAQVVTGEVMWAYRPDLAFSSAECSLDNARRFLE